MSSSLYLNSAALWRPLVPFSLFVLILTLRPFQFVPPEVSVDQLLNFSADDFAGNIVLFLPLGLLFPARRELVFFALALSASIESLQIFIPGRSTALFDLVGNISGALLGHLFVQVFSLKIVARVGAFLYLLAIIYLFFLFESPTSLSSWDESYQFKIGDEWAGGRQWKGQIEEATISSSSITLSGIEFLRRDGESVFGLAENEALTAELVNEIKANNSFSLYLRFKSFSINQSGPARLVTLSSGVKARNLTVGQSGKSLVVRVRNELTGPNGTKYEVLCPKTRGLLEDNALLLSFQGGALNLWLNDESYCEFDYANAWWRFTTLLFDETSMRSRILPVILVLIFPLGLLALIYLGIGARTSPRKP